MKVVRHKVSGRLVYREVPDFEEGKGIANAVLFGGGSEDDYEEIEATQVQWDAELLLRQQELPLPKSEHIGKLTSVNPALAKPATVIRKWLGQTHNVQCLVSQSVVDMWIAGTLHVGDFVIVSFIDEIPDTVEVNIAIVIDKVYESW